MRLSSGLSGSCARGALRATCAALLGMALSASAAHGQAPRPRVKLQAFPLEIALDTLVYTRATVNAPMGETFAALRAVYTQLKIAREIADSANGQIGNLRMRGTYSLGGQRLSVYFNCGDGLTGANADTWRLSIAIVTFLQPAGGDSTKVGTGLAAQAQDMGGASKDAVRCGSSGLLEARIADMVKQQLGK